MKGHLCDDRCKCPRCGNALYYRPESPNIRGEHACIDPDCAWSESAAAQSFDELAARVRMELEALRIDSFERWPFPSYDMFGDR